MNLEPQKTSDGEVWVVFASFKKDDPLHDIGTVIAPSREMAKVYAQKLYDEWGWRRMIVCPRREIVVLKAAE